MTLAISIPGYFNSSNIIAVNTLRNVCAALLGVLGTVEKYHQYCRVIPFSVVEDAQYSEEMYSVLLGDTISRWKGAVLLGDTIECYGRCSVLRRDIINTVGIHTVRCVDDIKYCGGIPTVLRRDTTSNTQSACISSTLPH